MTTWDSETPAGAGRDAARTAPAGTSEDERAAQRDAWRRMQASYRRGNRGGQWRRRAARGTLPARAGMIRRAPPGPPEGDDAA